MVTMMWIIVGAQWHVANRSLYYEPLPSTTEGCLNVPGLFNRTTVTTTTQNPTQVESVDEPFFMYRISFMYYTLLGALIVMVIGTIVSFICGAHDLTEIDRDHFPPFITRYMFKHFSLRSINFYLKSFEMLKKDQRYFSFLKFQSKFTSKYILFIHTICIMYLTISGKKMYRYIDTFVKKSYPFHFWSILTRCVKID